MKLTVHQILQLLGEADALFTKHGFYGVDGNFGSIDGKQIVAFAMEFEGVLKAHGLKIDNRIHSIIAIVPLLMAAIADGE